MSESMDENRAVTEKDRETDDLPDLYRDSHDEKSRNRWLFVAFLGLLFWAPIPLGSNRPWSLSLLESSIFLLLFLWIIQQWRSGVLLPAIFDREGPWLTLFLGWSVVPLWGMVPLHERLVSFFAPGGVELRRFANLPIEGPLVIDPYLAWNSWLGWMAWLGAFWLVLVLVNSRSRVKWVMLTLFASGIFQTIFGFISLHDDGYLVLWLQELITREKQNFLTGTYVNRNHFAGYLEITIAVGLGLSIAWMRHVKDMGQSFQDKFQALLNELSSYRGLILGLTMLMMFGMIMSLSRGGNLALFLALALVVLLTFFRRYRSKRERRLFIPLLIIALVGGAWFNLEKLTGRLINIQEKELARFIVYDAVQEKIKDYPLLGSGGGSFSVIFPLYRPESIKKFYNHVHNDHLEFLSDYGIVGYVLWISGIALLWGRIARAFIKRQDPFVRGVLFASLVSTLALLIHGLVDFNLQIPANIFTFYIMFGLGVVAAHLPHKEGGRSKSRRSKSKSYPSITPSDSV
ncbi:O-antigen ligase family protein [Magnetococcus sp. PR-3]|uniref:O-antigen ligase family protein n=1 Tax=Magnetococcus sp. PR-3 TaxID=3120355 RepID=UPI002FCE2E3D